VKEAPQAREQGLEVAAGVQPGRFRCADVELPPPRGSIRGLEHVELSPHEVELRGVLVHEHQVDAREPDHQGKRRAAARGDE
jgi:hypothetical protein